MFRKSFLALVFPFILLSATIQAQPVLPDIVGATAKGVNLLSWISQYDGIKSIAVQRSSDSVFNYAAIGYVKNIKKGPQAFIDGHPNPGNNWYRLYIVFNSDLTWYSNRFKLHVDSADLVNKSVLPPNDSLQKLAATIGTATASNPTVDSLQALVSKIKIGIPALGEIDAYSYIRSQYVFTNPFTGHVNIELPDVSKYQYTISFFDYSNKKILDITRLPESPLIIDKRNFQKKGLFKFELMRNKEKFETGYITIY